MSTKQISNHYNEITSRLDKIENIMTKTFVDYNDMKERLDILEEENKHLKEKLYDLIT
jgi:tetrahydromethanopterin S-methyltransferase subunit G